MLHRDTTEQIIGAFYGVYRELGYGFLESVYANAMAIELQHRALEFRKEVMTEVVYRGASAGCYRADMIVAGKVLVEMKANVALTDIDDRQVLNYLEATGLELGMLLNFGPKAQFRRLIFPRERQRPILN